MREEVFNSKVPAKEEHIPPFINKDSLGRVFQLINDGYQQWTSNRKIGTSRYSKKIEEVNDVVQSEPLSTKAQVVDIPVSLFLCSQKSS